MQALECLCVYFQLTIIAYKGLRTVHFDICLFNSQSQRIQALEDIIHSGNVNIAPPPKRNKTVGRSHFSWTDRGDREGMEKRYIQTQRKGE